MIQIVCDFARLLLVALVHTPLCEGNIHKSTLCAVKRIEADPHICGLSYPRFSMARKNILKIKVIQSS